MRILFTFAGGSGHFDPLVPIARAAVAAGHTVAFTGEPAMVPTVESVGFTAFPTGPNLGTTTRLPLLDADAERDDEELRDGFAGRTARVRSSDILALCAQWQPDLVVCDEIDFGSMIAAERLGLPYASVLVIASGSFVRTALLTEVLNAVRAEHGLPRDPGLAMLGRHLVLSPFPASYRDPAFPLPATARTLRLPPPDPDCAAPPWLADLPAAPTVYFTLGTIFNMESGDLFTRVIEGLRDLPVNLIVTAGRLIDPAEFGPQPSNVHIERYIPQSLLLPRCDLVVSHGGSGSVLGALTHGLPAVLIPMGADQPRNAARCAELGIARVLDAVAATPTAVRAAVSEVLADPGYRRAAEHLRDEIAALPGPQDAVRLLERIARPRPQVQVAVDCADPDKLAEFWADVLGYVVEHRAVEHRAVENLAVENLAVENLAVENLAVDNAEWSAVVDPGGTGPRVLFHRVPEPKITKNRLHLDVRAGGPRGTPKLAKCSLVDAEVGRLTARGATHVRTIEDEEDYFAVMLDPEGNEFCVC